MSLLELLLVVQTAVPGDTVPPYLAFPEPGLDDPAAYEGYETRVYRDASGNAFQIYLNRSQGRVVHLWADALNESAGFTARDSAGAPAELAWSSGSAVVGASGRTRSVSYGLEAPSSITLGLLLLGSMRVERDFQYARRDSLPLDATPFLEAELSQLIDHIAKLPGTERARHLALLGVKTPGGLRARLLPRITQQHDDTAWVVRVEQVSFDGKGHLWLALEGDARETVAAVTGGAITIRRPAGGVVRFGVRVTTDAPALTPLSRAEIFNDDFRRFFETVRGDAAHPDRFRLLDAGQVAQARAVLKDLQAVRENYVMVDDDFQLPVVAARYLSDQRVPAARKRAFLLEERRLQRLVSNLAYVTRQAAAYTRNPVATNLVGFPRDAEGRWISASWRDSRAGYGGGRFAMDVNVIWVPHALEAVGTILDALKQLGMTPAIRDAPLAGFVRDRAALERAIAVWRGAERHFRVAVGDVGRPVADRLRWLPRAEREYWEAVIQRTGFLADTLRFLALSLDENGRPIPIVNTDPSMLLLLEPVGLDRTLELAGPIMQPYPWGLFVDDLGPLVANDTYASRDVWERFRQDPYHSPTVVWGRDVNALLAGLAKQIAAAPSRSGAGVAPLRDALQRTVTAVDRSGLRHAELWSYRIENGRLLPVRYGTSSDVQLWSLTDLAVQFWLDRIGGP